MVVKVILEPVYHGVSQRLDIVLYVEGRLHNQYELSKFMEHIETAGKLLPIDEDPDA